MPQHEPEPATVGQFLRSAMEKKHLSIWELARAAKADKGYLNRILNGERPVSVGMSLRLADVLDLDPYSIAVLQARRHVFEYQAALRSAAPRTVKISEAHQPKPHALRNPRRAYFSPRS
jgi:plasmid maintenance system antidote protein VapI